VKNDIKYAKRKIDTPQELLSDCKTYCNEGQIFPAMKHFVETESMSQKSASQKIEKVTGGAVSANRACHVYRRRMGGCHTAPPNKNRTKKIKQPAMWKNVEMKLDSIIEYIRANYDPPIEIEGRVRTDVLSNLEMIEFYLKEETYDTKEKH
jgi:hypothetical protein